MAASRPFFLLAFVALAVGACAADADPSAGETTTDDSNEVKVDTRSPEARRQYDANVAFASSYVARCQRGPAERPRVLVTGFGRFMSIGNNATGRIVSQLVPSARYPETVSPPAGQVDDPAPQLSVGTTTIDFPGIGEVDVCGMVLPVYWDLAAILIAKEIEAFAPSFVMMNGVAGDRQPIWVELGSTNRAAQLDDGSNQLRPAISNGEPYARIVENANRSDDAQGNVLSWRAVESAARAAIEAHADDVDLEQRFGDLLPDVKLAGYPRASNTYLCNNVTYVTGWLMGHPNKEIRLLRASPAIRGRINEVRVRLSSDYRSAPRVFVHWPSELAEVHHAAGADVMKAIIGAQLSALRAADAPSRGDNALADPTLQGGDFF
jgi:pyrrolidone-carboxylate peptidase